MLSFDDPKLQAELSLFVMQPFYTVPERRPRRAVYQADADGPHRRVQ